MRKFLVQQIIYAYVIHNKCRINILIWDNK